MIDLIGCGCGTKCGQPSAEQVRKAALFRAGEDLVAVCQEILLLNHRADDPHPTPGASFTCLGCKLQTAIDNFRKANQ